MALTHSDESVEIMTYEELLQDKVRYWNSLEGELQGYNCDKCKNKGMIAFIDENNYESTYECSCMNIRKKDDYIKKSGIADEIKIRTFDNFVADEEWQVKMKSIVIRYAHNPEGWLFVAGQSGCGKSHLCIAASGVILNSGTELMYTRWETIFKKLNAVKFDDDKYSRIVHKLKHVKVLFIDDLFKSEKMNLDVAFEIINSRYIARIPTIITSEKMIEDIMLIDEGIAGRIKEMSEHNIVQILKKNGRNYRLRKNNI